MRIIKPSDFISDNYLDEVTDRYLPGNNTLSNPSRYKNLLRIIDMEGDEYVETAEEINFPLQADDKFYEVTDSTRNRIDYISYMYYATPLLWWVIAIASNLEDPLVIPVGTLLRIPSISTIYSVEGVLNNG